MFKSERRGCLKGRPLFCPYFCFFPDLNACPFTYRVVGNYVIGRRIIGQQYISGIGRLATFIHGDHRNYIQLVAAYRECQFFLLFGKGIVGKHFLPVIQDIDPVVVDGIAVPYFNTILSEFHV